MKQIAAILLLLFIWRPGNTPALAQTAPKLQWAKCHGGSSSDIALCVRHTTDGGYIVVGGSGSLDGEVLLHHGNSVTADYWIIKLNDSGSIVWQQSLGGSGNDIATDVKQTSDGGYIVAGFSKSNDGNVQGHHGSADSADYWIARLDAGGKIRWLRSYGGSGNDEAYSIDQTEDGGYIVAGFSSSNDGDVSGNHGGEDYWIIKLDADGNLTWQRSLGGSMDDEAYRIRQTIDGGFIVAGWSMSYNGDVTNHYNAEDYWIVKLDSLGEIRWQKDFGGSGNDVSYDITPTSDGGYIAIGYSNSVNGDVEGNHGAEDYWVIKLDSIGTLQWDRSLGGDNIDIGYRIVEMADGGYIVSGASSSNNGNVSGSHGGWDFWIAKLDHTGVLLWQRPLGGSGDEFGYGMDTTFGGGFILAGSTTSTDGEVTGHLGFEDYWVVRLSPEGTRTVHSAEIASPPGRCYPNPFSDHATIEFSHPMKSGAVLILYNILGAEVQKHNIPEGATNIVITRQELTNGAYTYRIMAGGQQWQSGNVIIE